MSISEYTLKSFDGLDLYALHWPSVHPSAVIAFVHGHGEHCRRYEDWFQQLSAHNFSIVTIDYRGHGRSQGKRGVITRFDDLLQDVAVLIEKASELYPGFPLVLYGHSLGGTMVLSYLLRHGLKPYAGVVTSPWLLLKHPPGKFRTALIRLANRIAPFLTFGTGFHTDDFSAGNDEGLKLEKDVYLHNRISPRLFMEAEKEAKWILAHIGELKTPLLLLQGKADLIMDGTGMEKLMNRYPATITWRVWEDAGHQLHNGNQHTVVLEFMNDWIKQQL